MSSGMSSARRAKPMAAKPEKMTKKRARRMAEQAASDEEDEEQLMPAAMQRKIAAQALLQQEEVESLPAQPKHSISSSGARAEGGDSDDDEADEADEVDSELEGAGEYYEDVEELELGEDEQKALDVLMGGGAPTRTLADVIMAKINERAGGAAAAGEGGGGAAEGDELVPDLPPKVLEVYTSVGKVLKTYRSGKLPKAFKIVPRLANWEEVLYATDPDSWTPAATSEATRLFASNLNHKMAQRFFNLVLLPAVQNDIADHGKLNFHLYLALKRALYKPSAFFKGLLLPLCEGRCTVREALIIGSVLQKVSVPMLHAAVAILKLAEMGYTPATTLFLRTLLLKKYALPYRVVDALVEYFVGFKDSTDIPPVLWQQTLLAFAQHYKAEITADQKESLKAVLRAQPHASITPEIRRELFSARTRGEAGPILGVDGGADAMHD